MEQGYWGERERASVARARTASSAEARLVHFDLAGRYSVRAANSAAAQPLAGPSPSSAGMADILRLALSSGLPPVTTFNKD